MSVCAMVWSAVAVSGGEGGSALNGADSQYWSDGLIVDLNPARVVAPTRVCHFHHMRSRLQWKNQKIGSNEAMF